ncbi:cytochrome b-c1 complex subunit 9 [Carettochelys insculpta]|uniref:cytochrome b-c1 complex subunit 9 n=1 Tax=Carettochelys insculpta TaxID=44489 RepID=UPI003EBD2796
MQFGAAPPARRAARGRTASPRVPRGRTRRFNFRAEAAALCAAPEAAEDKMPLGSRLYAVFFRRTSTFALTIVLGAVLFERAFDQAADAFYARLNRGKLWKHIKHNYEIQEK